MKQHVTVFGSGRIGKDDPGYSEAGRLGRLLAGAGFIHVSGGYGGTMEAGARGAREAGGETVGITIESWGPPNPFISRCHPMPDLFSRLKMLLETGDAYIVLPGATGTLIELAFAWERCNKGLDSKKPIILLGTFWKSVVETVKTHMPLSPGGGESIPGCLFGDFLWETKTPEEAVQLLNELLKKGGGVESH